MIEIARKHFSYTGPATAGDGRRFLNECRRQYDFCVIDTYSGDTFPFHLSTLEAFRAARRVLKPGGILALNYIGAPGGGAFASLHRTIGEVFPHRLGIGGEPGEDVQTITLFASDRPIRFNRGWLDLGGPVTGVDPVSADISRLTVAPTGSGAVVLTDDLNPIDSLRADEALRWRVRTARNIGPQALLL
jgi:SAM-dependent methyltransferase